MNEEAWRGDVEEQALAEEFYVWLTPMRNELADAEWVRVLGVRRRSSLTDFLRDKKWSQARNQVRKMWMAERTHYLPMSYEEVKAEYDAKVEAKRAAKALAEVEADALGAETEVHDGDAPYAIATDGSNLPASGVSDESIGTDSTPLAGKPRDVELGDKPDAELPDDAAPSIVPTAASDASALTPVTETPVETPVASDEAPAASGDAPVGSDASAQPLGTPLDVAPAGDAPAGDAPAGDAPPASGAPAGDNPADAPVAGGPVGNASAVNASLDAPAASVAGAGVPSEEVGAPVAGEPASGVPIGADEDASGADASESDAAAGDATPTGGDAPAGDASGSRDAGAGALGSVGAIAEVKLSLTGEPLMPSSVP